MCLGGIIDKYYYINKFFEYINIRLCIFDFFVWILFYIIILKFEYFKYFFKFVVNVYDIFNVMFCEFLIFYYSINIFLFGL